MGRKTYESIGKALPDRINWVLSRRADFPPADCRVGRAPLREAQAGVGRRIAADGRSAARRSTGCACRMRGAFTSPWCTRRSTDGDTFFSGVALLPNGVNRAASATAADERNACAYSFLTLDRAGA